uniref:Centrosomal protein 126 n=1 Tax=Echeneis naucrates TaxID=173247 RepID=A0A665TQJ8_ECHNA
MASINPPVVKKTRPWLLSWREGTQTDLGRLREKNQRFGGHGGLEDERKLLVEEQKFCRARARKFSLETKRRRKALEERQKQWDVQEQRLRENILQQRRQQVQDATERFQRAHLPPSQRRRQCYSFSFQDSHLSDCCNSESLSSKDSLENEDLNQSAHNCYSSFVLDSEKPQLNLEKKNYFIPTSQLTSSGMMLLGDNLNQSQKLHELKQKKKEDYEGSNNKMYVSKGSWGFTSGQMLKTETQTTEDNCNFLSSCEIIGSDLDHSEVHYPQNCVNNNLTHTVTSGTAVESLCPKQEALLDPKHQRVHDDKHPSATEILFPAKNSKDILSWAPPKPNIFLNDSTTDNVSQEQTIQQTGKENSYLSSKKEPSASINNLNKVSQSESKTEKSTNTAMLQHTSLSNIQSDTLKCLKCPEEDVQKFPVSVEASHSVCEVRFIKGILKKPSKYMSGDTACVYGSGQLIFAKQVALEIRDSIELTKVKAKDMEGNAIKKKLRWFDEVHVGKEDKAQNTMKQMKGKYVSLSQSKKNPEDHQLSLATVSGACKPGSSMTPPATTGYHFTKQAWADVGVQVSLPQRQADEVKVPWSNSRTGGPKVPWRERSARAGAGPVSSRTRKGTVIRPQSAIEVNQIAKPQGKMMVPCPPPRIDSLDEKTAYITKTPYGMDHASVNCKQAAATEQALHKITSEGFFSPYTHHLIGTDSAVVYTPLPPSYACPVSATSGHQEAPGCSRRKGMAFNEKALCLDFDLKNFLPHNDLLSSLLRTHANLCSVPCFHQRQQCCAPILLLRSNNGSESYFSTVLLMLLTSSPNRHFCIHLYITIYAQVEQI